MIDGIISESKNSRLVKSTLPASYEEFKALVEGSGLPIDLLFNAAGWQQQPTFLNKQNLLTDDTAAAIGLTIENPTVDDAIRAGAYKGKNMVLQAITTSSTWKTPKAYGQKFTIFAIGGGGAGGKYVDVSYLEYATGGGGGSGRIAIENVEIPEGESVTVVVGAGGAWPEGAGGQTSFGTYAVAPGGDPGNGLNGGNGGAGGGGGGIFQYAMSSSTFAGNGGDGEFGGGGGAGYYRGSNGGLTYESYGGAGGKYGGGGGGGGSSSTGGAGGKYGGNGGGFSQAGNAGAVGPVRHVFLQKAYAPLAAGGAKNTNYPGGGGGGYNGAGGGGGGGGGGFLCRGGGSNGGGGGLCTPGGSGDSVNYTYDEEQDYMYYHGGGGGGMTLGGITVGNGGRGGNCGKTTSIYKDPGNGSNGGVFILFYMEEGQSDFPD